MSDKKHCIVGAGLVGSLLSVMLAKRGLKVDVIERRQDPRKSGEMGGRSINLALSNRGFKALEMVGLADEVRKICIPMHGRMVHEQNGDVRFMKYGEEGEFINSVSRGGLNQLLLEKADEAENVQLHFNQKLEDVNVNTGNLSLKNIETGEENTENYDVIFGTDGAFSATRLGLMKTDRFDFTYKQDYLEHGYKELTIPAAEGGGWRIESNCLHIWPRKSFMMIALPNLDGSFTCTLFLAFDGEVSFSQLNTDEEIKTFFNKYFADVVPHMPTLVADFNENPTSSLVTMYLNPWHYTGKCLLLGDAAHAIVPFYGQGMNAGFEDCFVIEQLMEEKGYNWAEVFPEFNKLRKPNGDAIAELALRNFIEMRDLVADQHFILKNKIDRKLNQLYPDKWMTMYRMVTFSDLPYSEALRLGKEHDAVLEQIVKSMPNVEGKLETDEFKEVADYYVN